MSKLFCLAFVAAVSIPCFAADSPWDGTWKLNEAKSKMTGTTVTFTKDGDMYSVDEGTVKFKFGCDGKDYPVLADRTITCTQNGNVYTTVTKGGGQVLRTTTHEISADGKTITDTSTGTKPDGTTFSDESTSKRVGAGQGLVGTWKEVKVSSNVPSTMVLQVNGDMFRFEDPAYKEVSETKLDGTPGPITGGSSPPGMMYATTKDGTDRVKAVVSLDGKVLAHEEMTLSADGKTLTDVQWRPGKETEKTTYVYEKQ